MSNRVLRLVDLGSYRRRIVVSTAALSLLVAVVLVVAVQLTLAGSAVDTVDRLLGDRADTLVSSVDGATSGDRLVVPSSDVDPGVAVYDAQGGLVAGFVPPHQSREFGELSRTGRERSRTLGDAFALVGRPFTTKSGAHGVVVLSERLAPYEDNERDALEVSVLAGVLLVLVATGLAAWASRRALAPVAQMARTAEGWSEHDLGQRFDLGPPSNEIRALGQTLDGLLEKVERTIVAEQRLTSELAHELRTPLTAAHGTAELIAMRTDLDDDLRADVDDLLLACEHMAKTVTSLLDLARSQAAGRPEESSDVGEVVRSVAGALDTEGRIGVDVPAGCRVMLPADLLARAVSPVLDNALRYADQVAVTARRDGRRAVVVVNDDGPGVDTQLADRIFDAGHTHGPQGSGLGLALARRIARSAGGDVRFVPGGRGATFEIALPAAPA